EERAEPGFHERRAALAAGEVRAFRRALQHRRRTPAARRTLARQVDIAATRGSVARQVDIAATARSRTRTLAGALRNEEQRAAVDRRRAEVVGGRIYRRTEIARLTPRRGQAGAVRGPDVIAAGGARTRRCEEQAQAVGGFDRTPV